jgi:nucleoside-diphosphate-sugar epimerase
MRVLITGGTGSVGKATTERLIRSGHEVRVLGIEPDVAIPGAEYHQCDILNYNDLLERTRGCDGIIHLAAIRSPILAPGQNVFQVNVAGTFNVFEAAAVCGIRRVVQASSINAVGYFYGTSEPPTHYLPLDEDHPAFTTDPYSLSKQIVEDLGAYYWRRDGISSVAMRFPGVYAAAAFSGEKFRQRRAAAHQMLDALLQLPEAEQQARLDDVRQRAHAYRATRPLEYHPEHPNPHFPSAGDDPLLNMYVFERYNFWAAIDERDAAQSLEKGLLATYEGAHPLFINDDHNTLLYDARALARLFFPHVTALKSDLSGTQSLVSIERARALIGFQPEYSVANLSN